VSNPNMDAPQTTLWQDRRPLGIWWPASSQHVRKFNQHGLFGLMDTRPCCTHEVIKAALKQPEAVWRSAGECLTGQSTQVQRSNSKIGVGRLPRR